MASVPPGTVGYFTEVMLPSEVECYENHIQRGLPELTKGRGQVGSWQVWQLAWFSGEMARSSSTLTLPLLCLLGTIPGRVPPNPVLPYFISAIAPSFLCHQAGPPPGSLIHQPQGRAVPLL